MTKKQLKFREIVSKKYLEQDIDACVNAVMEVYNRIKDNNGRKFLCRYRKLQKYELDALQNETIFMRWPSTYEDSDDCTPVYDFQEIGMYIIQKKYSPLIQEELLKQLLKQNDEYKRTIMENPKFIESVNKLRDICLISCFTEKIDNKKMWKEYAADGTGICILYDAFDVLEFVKKHNSFWMMPIRYVEGRKMCRDIMLDHHDILEETINPEIKYIVTCMTKEMEFKFEEEWRLILHKEKDKTTKDIGIVVPFIKPVCVICGENINQESQEYKDLIKIANDKCIGLYYYNTVVPDFKSVF